MRERRGRRNYREIYRKKKEEELRKKKKIGGKGVIHPTSDPQFMKIKPHPLSA
jgi:hypothetical protein